MAVLRYNGPWDTRTLWGIDFPKGKTVVVDDQDLVAKALNLDGFEQIGEEVKADIDEPPAHNPDPDDYPSDSMEPTAFDDLKIPRVAPGTIPSDWETQHHSTRIKLAKTLRPDLAELIKTADDADGVIRDEIEPR
jgi:hypothetical protein